MLDMHSIHYLLGFIGDIFLATGIAIIYFNFRPKGQTFMKSLMQCSQPVLFMLVLAGMGVSNLIEVFRGDNSTLRVVQLIIAVICVVLATFALIGSFRGVREPTQEELEDVPVEAREVEEPATKPSSEAVIDTDSAVVSSPENEKGA